MGHGARLAAPRAGSLVNPDRWARIKELFANAVALPAEERSAFITLECGGDAALIGEVESLLAAHDRPGEFLETGSSELRAAAFATPGAVNRIGERIGAYRIVEMVGTGGMGDVFKAVRDDKQYRAEVAIKLMRADMRNPLSEQRFRTERQILAALDHRNIARLLDGGTTPNGLPYVVMELVTGAPIDRYCEDQKLAVRARVQLFLQVCAAVTYAHQHLVVHRDLKPNNILVTADGSVKLLDFGIAKLLEADAPTAERDATVTQIRAMTLDYASPEQVSGGTVTTVSDVYSLGVVLYRLLTGKSPYRQQANDAQRMAEILGDATPTRPSQLRELDTDLDHILLMALRKEPQKRYGSVEQLASDLRNYLGGRPVAARRGTLGYRVGKYVRRNKVPIAAGFLVLLSLVGGLWIAIREAQEAERQRVVAQRHFDSVRSLANKLIAFNDEVSKLEGSAKAQEILVKTSLQYLDTLYQEGGTDPALQEELGIAYRKVGDIQGGQMATNRGDPKAAMKTYEKSNALLEPLLARNPANVRLGAFLSGTYMRQSRTLLYTEGARPALVAAEKAVKLSAASRQGFETEALYAGQLGDAYAVLAQSLGVLNRNDEAREATSKLIALGEDFSRAHPEDEMGLRGLAKAYINTAITDDPRETIQQRVVRTEPLLRKAMVVQERLIALDPHRYLYQWNLAETQYNLGDMLFDNGEYAAALELFREASAVMIKHDPNDSHSVLVNAMNDLDLAKALVQARNLVEAETVFARVDPALRKLMKDGSTVQSEFSLGQVCLNRGYLYMEYAQDPRRSASEQTSYWRRARDSLREGVGYVENVNKTIALFGVEKKVWDDGLAALATAEKAVSGG
jgi:eukaryotic-like serine/threonine-protein kinase